MAVPAHKSKTEPETVEVDAAEAQPVDLIAASGEQDITPVASPAKDLQDKLDAHFVPMNKKMSARFVTLLVMFTCLGTWISGVGLYGTLQAV